MSYTPGPWIHSACEDTRNGKMVMIPIIDPDTMDESVDRRAIAECNDLRKDCWANARLIAAAPDMYESGKEMAEAVALLSADDGRIIGLLPILCRLRQALAKAEGRE